MRSRSSADRHVTQVGDRRIGWTETGSGPPVVLVHGLGTSGAWWSPTIPMLSRTHRVLTVDLVGFGRSNGQAVRLDAAADQLAAWAAAIGLERAGWIGHSMGGLVTADLAARHPDLIERLVLVDAAGPALPQRVGRHLRNLLRGGPNMPFRAYPIALTCIIQCGPLTIARAAHQILTIDLAERLARITAPTLVVWGERDRLLPIAFGRRLAAAIPGSRFVSIADAGHSPMWEQPAAFEWAIGTFLADAPPKPEPDSGPPNAYHAELARATTALVVPTAADAQPSIAGTGGRIISRYVPVGDLSVHVRLGRPDAPLETPPVVLVHGFVLASRYHVATMRHLAQRYLVLAPDLPGFGWSQRPSRVLDVPELASALVATMDAAGIARAVLVGSSLGAQVVAQAAADHPDRVLGVVLTGPTFDPAEPSRGRHLLRLLRDVPHERPSIWLEHLQDWLLAGPPRAVRTLGHAWRHRIADVLPEVRVSTVVVRGRDDPLVPRTWATHAASLLPVGRAVEIGPAGHAVDHRAPGAMARVITDLAEAVTAVSRPHADGTMPMHIVTATHRRRPNARPRRARAGPPN